MLKGLAVNGEAYLEDPKLNVENHLRQSSKRDKVSTVNKTTALMNISVLTSTVHC